MIADDPATQAFLELYTALPRQGPGSAAATRAVLQQLPTLPSAPRIIDAGCGSGSSTLVLAAALPSATILAVDVLDVLLERLAAALAASDLTARVHVRRESMDTLREPPASVDLIWCEGAIYNVGIERALRTWTPLLRLGGCVVFSEACWWTSDPLPELAAYWATAYPAMRDEASVIALIEALGFVCVATRRLEREAWFTEYYDPLARRCTELRANANPVLAQVIAEAEAEIASFRANPDHCGYTFFVAQRSPVSMPTFASNTLEHQPVFSWHREHAGTIYTSGHVAIDVDSGRVDRGDLRHEARVALTNLSRTLERAGSSLDKVLKVTVYLTDMREFGAFNRVYAEFFAGEQVPARVCVEVSRLPYDLRVAIEAIAHV